MSRLSSLISEKCPCCEKGDVFDYPGNVFRFKMPKIKKSCEHCGHRFEKEPGFFIGAMYVSYGLAIAQMVAIFLITQFFLSAIAIIWLIIACVLLLSVINFRYSRMIWMYLFTKNKSLTTG